MSDIAEALKPFMEDLEKLKKLLEEAPLVPCVPDEHDGDEAA